MPLFGDQMDFSLTDTCILLRTLRDEPFAVECRTGREIQPYRGRASWRRLRSSSCQR